VSHAEEHFTEWRDAPEMAVGNTRTKEVRRERSIDSSIQDIPVTVAAEIGNATQPALGVISDRCAAAVQV